MAIPSRAQWLCSVQNEYEILSALQWAKARNLPCGVLGGGSNTLLPERLNGLVIHMAQTGWRELRRDSQHVWLQVAAGHGWHQLVVDCIDNGWFGLENLALIPGAVGAAPIQNIGAYGVEVAQYIDAVHWLDFASGETLQLSVAECEFGYRDSIFKHRLKGQGAILHVTFRLDLQWTPCLNYPAIQDWVDTHEKRETLTARDVFQAVCEIRQSRLPNPDLLPNSGSFFKNPVVSQIEFQQIQLRFPAAPYFPVSEQEGAPVKIPAAWLIEQVGWKGGQWQGVAVHKHHALVVVNPRRKPLTDVLSLAEKIQQAVEKEFSIQLEREPQCLQLS